MESLRGWGEEVMYKPSFKKLIQVSQVDMSMEEHMSIEETVFKFAED